MKMQSLIQTQQLQFSSYPHPFNERAAKWARKPDIRPLLKFRLSDHSIHLELEGETHQSHVTLLVGHSALIFRGIDDQLWKSPILCFDTEALCFELREWHEMVVLEAGDFPEGKNAHSVQEGIEQMFEDPFTSALTDLAYELDALSLIESLPEVSLK